MKPLEKGLALHVGLPKTGTTTLQRSLFSNHPQIDYIGKNIHSSIERGCQSVDILRVLKHALWSPLWGGNTHQARKHLIGKVYPTLDVDRFLLGSWEGLGCQSTKKYAEMLRKLLEIFGSCRILFVLRNPLTQVPSEYLQNLSGHFIKNNKNWMGLSPYIDVEEWFARRVRSQGAQDVLNYANNIQVSINMLGADNVGVFLFEDLMSDPQAYYQAISRFIGIDPEKALPLTRDKHLHKRISQKQMDWMKESQNSLWKGLILRTKSAKARKALFGQHVDDGPPAKVVLSRELKQTIENLTRDGNRWLVENCDLPLRKYDYPL
jgi:hypothetical protein